MRKVYSIQVQQGILGSEAETQTSASVQSFPSLYENAVVYSCGVTTAQPPTTVVCKGDRPEPSYSTKTVQLG